MPAREGVPDHLFHSEPEIWLPQVRDLRKREEEKRGIGF
jgi:hypothetical protein